MAPVRMAPIYPVPKLTPNLSRDQFPTKPPMIPIKMFPNSPKLLPLKIVLPSHPAMAPIMIVLMISMFFLLYVRFKLNN